MIGFIALAIVVIIIVLIIALRPSQAEKEVRDKGSKAMVHIREFHDKLENGNLLSSDTPLPTLYKQHRILTTASSDLFHASQETSNQSLKEYYFKMAETTLEQANILQDFIDTVEPFREQMEGQNDEK